MPRQPPQCWKSILQSSNLWAATPTIAFILLKGDANADITGVNEDNPCSYALLGYMDIMEHGPEWRTEAILVLRGWLFIRLGAMQYKVSAVAEMPGSYLPGGSAGHFLLRQPL